MKRLAPLVLSFSFACAKTGAPPTAATVPVTTGSSAADSAVAKDAPKADFVIEEKPRGEWSGSHANVPVTPTAIFAHENLVIAAGPGKILRSGDRGRHWTVHDGPVGELDIVWTRAGILVAGKEIFRSTDDGRTWKKLKSPPGPVRAIAATSWGKLWAVIDNGDTPSSIARSRDNGESWHEVKYTTNVMSLYDVVGARGGEGALFAGKAPAPGGSM